MNQFTFFCLATVLLFSCRRQQTTVQLTTPDKLVEGNYRFSIGHPQHPAQQLKSQSALEALRGQTGELEIRAACYDLRIGIVTFFPSSTTFH